MRVLFYLAIALFSMYFLPACKKQQNVPAAQTCDLSTSPITQEYQYDFESEFLENFENSSRWISQNAVIGMEEGKGVLTADAENTSNALEAWHLYKVQMPMNRSWEISAEVTIPLYWNSNGGKKAQVGIGLFVGKPVESGESSQVYECNFACINGKQRFVQAQLIQNRLGQDPIDVQFQQIDDNVETLNLKIRYCASYSSISLLAAGNQVGDSKPLNKAVSDWNITESGMLDIGIMGFAEKTTINENSPTIDEFKVAIY
ncbi:MAG: hypothetical protein MI810_15605 [Flavobacteriales bacterium]|nr:hypothetical protein [Flavobacteriales bacterium]